MIYLLLLLVSPGGLFSLRGGAMAMRCRVIRGIRSLLLFRGRLGRFSSLLIRIWSMSLMHREISLGLGLPRIR